MCDLSSVSIVYPCYWIGWCVHVIHITQPNPQVWIHTYTRCLSHIRVATHMCPGAVWQREKYELFTSAPLFAIFSVRLRSSKIVLNLNTVLLPNPITIYYYCIVLAVSE